MAFKMFKTLVLISALIALATSAPADEPSAAVGTATPPVVPVIAATAAAPKIDAPAAAAVVDAAAKTPEVAAAAAAAVEKDKGVVVSDESAWSFLKLSSHTASILTSVLGTVFILGGIALAYFYFFGAAFISGLLGPPQTEISQAVAPYAYNYQPQQQYATSRSLESNWSWTQVLYLIELAHDSYEKFDFESMDCQKKALCELAQQQNTTELSETARKISNGFSYYSKRAFDVVETLPMPAVVMSYMKAYREAVSRGNDMTQDCAAVYSGCKFSLKEEINKYQKKIV